MKKLLLICLFLVGCGSGGGTSEQGLPGSDPVPDVPATCKAFHSNWTSDSDLSQMDFTNLTVGSPAVEWGFVGSNGLACNYYSNPNHALNAQIVSFSHPSVPAEYTHALKMTWTLAIGSTCAEYDQANSSTDFAHIKFECDQLTLCKASNFTNCKTFH